MEKEEELCVLSSPESTAPKAGGFAGQRRPRGQIRAAAVRVDVFFFFFLVRRTSSQFVRLSYDGADADRGREVKCTLAIRNI